MVGVVANPDDAAEENSGNVDIDELCICHVQLGRAGEPMIGLFSAALSCVHDR